MMQVPAQQVATAQPVGKDVRWQVTLLDAQGQLLPQDREGHYPVEADPWHVALLAVQPGWDAYEGRYQGLLETAADAAVVQVWLAPGNLMATFSVDELAVALERRTDVVRVLADRLGEAKAALDKLVRKAQRYGAGDVGYEVGPAYERKVRVQVGQDVQGYAITRQVTKRYVDLLVFGPAPKVGEYKFVARLEPVAPGQNLVCTVPGETADVRFRTSTQGCDHCNARRMRKDTYVVEREDGRQLQVGGNCLRDYLHGQSPAALAAKFSFLREAEALGGMFCGMGGEPMADVETALMWSLVAVRLWGWCSAGQARAEAARENHVTPTKGYAAMRLFQRRDKYNEREWDQLSGALREAEDRATAQAIMAWAATLGQDGRQLGEYEYNLHTACGADVVTWRRLGIVCSAVQAYARHMEQELRRTVERKAAAESQWVGKEGERLRDVPATVTFTRAIYGDYGTTVLVKLLTQEGNVLVWFCTANVAIDVGAQLLVTGTVKRHTQRDGAKETQLTRCKVQPVVGA